MEKPITNSVNKEKKSGTLRLNEKLSKDIISKAEMKIQKQHNFYQMYPEIKRIIEREINVRLNRLIRLSPHKKELMNNKLIISEMVHRFVYDTLKENVFWKGLTKVLTHDDETIKKVGIGSLEHIIRIHFEVADLILASFEKSSQMLKKNIQKLKKEFVRAKKRADKMSGKKLSKEKKAVLEKIINKRNELKKYKNSAHEYSWKCAIKSVYSKISEQERRDLFNLKPEKFVPLKLQENQIKSISQTISYHQNKSHKLPK